MSEVYTPVVLRTSSGKLSDWFSLDWYKRVERKLTILLLLKKQSTRKCFPICFILFVKVMQKVHCVMLSGKKEEDEPAHSGQTRWWLPEGTFNFSLISDSHITRGGPSFSRSSLSDATQTINEYPLLCILYYYITPSSGIMNRHSCGLVKKCSSSHEGVSKLLKNLSIIEWCPFHNNIFWKESEKRDLEEFV